MQNLFYCPIRREWKPRMSSLRCGPSPVWGSGLSNGRPTFRRMCEASDLVGRIVNQVNAYLTHKGSLLTGRIVDAMIIAWPSSTKNTEGMQGMEMRQTKRCGQWHFGVMARVVRYERRGFWA
jgi:hypothetical protein